MTYAAPPLFYPQAPPCFYSYSGSGYLVEVMAYHKLRLREAGVDAAAVDGYCALFSAVHTGMVDRQLPEQERAAVCEHLATLADMMIARRQRQPVQQRQQPMYRVSPRPPVAIV